jgi:undecaprenyl-diphosphatase
LLASSLFILTLFAFSYIAHEVVLAREDLFDPAVFGFFGRHVSKPVVGVLHFLTFFGSHWFLFPAYVLLVAGYLIRGHRQDAIDIGVIGLTSTVLLFTMKHFFHRTRPDLPLFKAVAGYSFPSGHALSSFIFCAVLIHLIRWSGWPLWVRWAVCIFLLLFSLAIGISRIVLRVHYPSDVLAGFCLGFAWVTLLLSVQERLRQQMHIRSDHPAQMA